MAEQGLAVRPANLSAMGVARKTDIRAGGDRGMDEVRIMQKHQLEIVRLHAAHGGGNIGVDAAVLVNADEGETRPVGIIGGRGGRLLDVHGTLVADKKNGFILQHDPFSTGGIVGLRKGGSEFGRIMISENEEGSQRRREWFKKPLNMEQRGCPEPGTMAEIAGDDEKLRFDFSKGVTPAFERARPAGDVEIGKVQHRKAVEGRREPWAGQFEEINFGLGKHTHSPQRCV